MGDSEPFRLLQAFDEAMKAEGIPEMQREHVINRLLYGTPHPAERQQEPAQQITVHVSGPDLDPAYLRRHMALLQQARDRII